MPDRNELAYRATTMTWPDFVQWCVRAQDLGYRVPVGTACHWFYEANMKMGKPMPDLPLPPIGDTSHTARLLISMQAHLRRALQEAGQ